MIFARWRRATGTGSKPPLPAESIRRDVARRSYDFLDLGSSTGGSIAYCKRRFGAKRGLGVERSSSKAQRLREQGFEILECDLFALDLPPASFRFVSMMDVLEHLPDFGAVERALGVARDLARDFLFIRHPLFDDTPYLATLGLKQFWTDWHGHTAHVPVAMFLEIFRGMGLAQVALNYRDPAHDSDHTSLLPLGAPCDQHHYDPKLHGPKPHVVFPRPVYGQVDIFVALRDYAPADWTRLTTDRG
jgi:SAM-dependent methyltransferase